MIRTVLYLLTVIPLFLQAQEDCRPEFGGLYMARSENEQPETIKYLRFYKDGMVILVSSDDKGENVARWFNRDLENIATGKYKIKNCRISFSTKNDRGKSEYAGLVKENELMLTKQVNGQKSKRHYTFKFSRFEVKN